MSDKKEIIDGIEVDVEKAKKLLRKIIVMEKTNLSTRKMDTTAIIKDIKKKIAEEVTCY